MRSIPKSFDRGKVSCPPVDERAIDYGRCRRCDIDPIDERQQTMLRERSAVTDADAYLECAQRDAVVEVAVGVVRIQDDEPGTASLQFDDRSVCGLCYTTVAPRTTKSARSWAAVSGLCCMMTRYPASGCGDKFGPCVAWWDRHES
jgi:hypothetical protein